MTANDSHDQKLVAARRKAKQYVALGFDSRVLRLALARRDGTGVQLRKLVAFDLPGDVDHKNAEAMGRFIRRTLESLKWHAYPVLIVVPRSQVVLKPLNLPAVKDVGVLAGMVQFQAAKELPFSPAEAVIDFAMESHYDAEDSGPAPVESTVGVLVAAARQSVVDFYHKLAAAADVKLLRLCLRPYANLAALRIADRRGSQRRHDNQAIVHITCDETEIAVLVDGDLAFSRSTLMNVPIKPDETEAKLAALEGEDDAAAGPVPPGVQQRAIDAVATEISRSLRSYQAVQRGRRFDRIIIAGGTGIETAVRERVALQLNVTTELFEPDDALPAADNPRDLAAFISVVGLALAHRDPAALPIDFLTPKRPRKARNRKRMLATAAAAVVGVMALLTVLLLGYDLHVRSSHKNELVRQLNELKKDNKVVVAMAKRHAPLEAWQQRRVPWLLHWARLSQGMPPATELYIETVKSVGTEGVQFTIHARTSEVVTKLGEALREANYTFKLGSVTTSEDPHGYPYTTTVTVLAPEDDPIILAEDKVITRPADDDSANVLRRERDGRRRGGDS